MTWHYKLHVDVITKCGLEWPQWVTETLRVQLAGLQHEPNAARRRCWKRWRTRDDNRRRSSQAADMTRSVKFLFSIIVFRCDSTRYLLTPRRRQPLRTVAPFVSSHKEVFSPARLCCCCCCWLQCVVLLFFFSLPGELSLLNRPLQWTACNRWMAAI